MKSMADDLADRPVAAGLPKGDDLDAVIRLTKLAAAYLRYSRDKPIPRSLDDQLVI